MSAVWKERCLGKCKNVLCKVVCFVKIFFSVNSVYSAFGSDFETAVTTAVNAISGFHSRAVSPCLDPHNTFFFLHREINSDGFYN